MLYLEALKRSRYFTTVPPVSPRGQTRSSGAMPAIARGTDPVAIRAVMQAVVRGAVVSSVPRQLSIGVLPMRTHQHGLARAFAAGVCVAALAACSSGNSTGTKTGS